MLLPVSFVFCLREAPRFDASRIRRPFVYIMPDMLILWQLLLLEGIGLLYLRRQANIHYGSFEYTENLNQQDLW
jgi:hypothetical protein